MALEFEAWKVAYTVKESARAWGVCPATVKNKIATGEVQSFTWAGRRLIHRDVIVAVIEAARASPTASASLRPGRAARKAADNSGEGG